MNRINKKLIPFGIVGLLVLISIACSELSVEVLTPTPESQVIVEDTPVAVDPTEDTTLSPVGVEWMQTANRLDVQVPEALSGLFYRSGDTLYLVDAAGTPVEVAGGLYDASLSPGLSGLAYVSEDEDLFLEDLNSGEITRLTDTPVMLENSVQWWQGRPDVLVYNMMPSESLGPWAGFLGAYDLAAGEPLSLDTVSSSYNGFSLSPDGQAILYDDAGEPVIYTWGAGVTKLDLESHGYVYTSYHAPAWSPDGSRVAFLGVGYEENSPTGASQAAVVIYRLVDGQVEERHKYELYGMRGAPELTWSPDGQYIAVTTPGDATAPDGPISLWILGMNGEADRYLGYSTTPIWSPDGRYLVYINWPAFGTEQGSYQQDAHVILMQTGVWEPQEVADLLGSSLMAWYQLP